MLLSLGLGHTAGYREQLDRRQQPTREHVHTFVRENGRLGHRGYRDKGNEKGERRVLKQVVEGASNRTTKKVLLRRKDKEAIKCVVKERLETSPSYSQPGTECDSIRRHRQCQRSSSTKRREPVEQKQNVF